ncbi:LysR family transcriptional regulator [Pelagibacterium lentulum]|nr:LysR family transcriptional regulator [Pelagibacterium lentulum]
MMLTLRQIEIVRAIMVAGSIAGAAKLLNVSQPGISRTMKHIEASIGIKLFVKRSGRYTPSEEAQGVFRQINDVHRKVDDLQIMLTKLNRGHDVELSIGSVPSLAQVMVPRAVVAMQKLYPELHFNIELLKIEEAIDYLMLERGEVIFMSYRLDHPSIVFEPLSRGKLVFIAPPSHAEAGRDSISVREIARYPLIGIDPNDPYGRIMADLFRQHGLQMNIPIKARFGTTVAALVERQAGVAVLDSFSIAGMRNDRLRVIPIKEDTHFQTYVATRRDTALSGFAERFIETTRGIMDRHLD